MKEETGSQEKLQMKAGVGGLKPTSDITTILEKKYEDCFHQYRQYGICLTCGFDTIGE